MPRWTPEARLKQAERIRQWSPWSKSTGPRSEEGKNRSKTNAWKGGVRWQVRGYAEIIRLWEHDRKVNSSFGGRRDNRGAYPMSAADSLSAISRLPQVLPGRTVSTNCMLPPCLLRVSLTLAALLSATAWAADAVPKPEGGLQELLDVRKEIKSALPIVRSAIVALETDKMAASGVIVTPDGLILTAAHVVANPHGPAEPGMKMKVILADGRTATGTALGMDTATDAAMVQIDGKRTDWPFVDLNRNASAALPGQWCFALGHPGGYDKDRGEVLRVGKVLKTTANSLQTDCVLMGGDSGGALFSPSGALIGIHSQISEGRDQNVHVSLAPFFRSWEALKESQIVRIWDQGGGGWLGVATRLGENGLLEVDQVAPNSPAARAGMRSGDKLVSFDGKPLRDRPHFSAMVNARAAGDPVVLVVRNRSGEKILTMKLAQRPPD